METWRAQLYADELYHYGVKGMRWRRGRHPQNFTQGSSGALNGSNGSGYRTQQREPKTIRKGQNFIERLFSTIKPKRASKKRSKRTGYKIKKDGLIHETIIPERMIRERYN